MSNDEITPIHHTSMSALGTTAAGTAGGALKGGLTTALMWIGGAALVAVAIGSMFMSGGTAGAFWTPVFGAIAGAFHNPLTYWALGGLAVGTATVAIPSGLGAIVGGFSGGAKASARVSQENAAAQQVEAQIAASQMQYAAPAAQVNVGYPAAGSRFNEASAQLDATTAQYGGRMNDGVQLSAAR